MNAAGSFLKIKRAILLGSLLLTLSIGQTDWTWRNPLPQGNTLRSVIWTGNQAVAVGHKGTVVNSPDGKTWTKQVSIDTNILYSVAWTGSQLVAVGDNGILYTSPSGTVWTKRSSGIKNALFSVTWTGAQLVAVGPNDVITSVDGVTWTKRENGDYLNSVIWADTQLVAVGWGGKVRTSPDGIVWTTRPTNTSEQLNSVTWTGSQYIAVGDRGTIITSPNGLTWKTQTAPTPNAFRSVTWTGKLAVAVAGSPLAYTSPDGVTWTQTTDMGERFNPYSLVWNGSQVIEVGQGGRISGSPTGETWTNIAGDNEEIIVGGAWTGREYAAIGNLGRTYTSLDGFSWNKQTLRNNARFLKSVAWADSLLVAVGLFGVIYTSPDAVTWTNLPAPINTQFNSVVWNGSKVVAVGNAGSLITSSNGVTWTIQSSGTSSPLASVVWNGKRFFAFGGSALLTSPDGETWTSHPSPGFDLASVAWSGSQFAAVGGYLGSPSLYTSPDGLTWTERDAAGANNLTSVAWVENKFIAVDDRGGILTSSDGASWNRVNSVTDNHLAYVSSMGDLILAGGYFGTLLSAPLDDKVAAPRLSSPPAGALDMPVSNLPLTWTRSASAATFHVQVSTNSLFSNIISQDSTLTDIAFQVGGLAKFKTYYWRVRAKNADGVSAWTAFRRFRTIPPPPPTPILKSPSDGAAGIQLPMTLQWSPINTAYDYRVQVSTDSNFTGMSAKDTIMAHSEYFVKGLAFTTSYYWRVQSNNTAGTSAWSAYRHFTTNIAPPAPPVLTTPSKSAYNQMQTLVFAWNKVPEAATYHIRIAYNKIPWPIFLEDSTISDSQRLVGGLDENNGFYWVVRAKNSGGVSDWSAQWEFRTLALPKAPKLYFPFQDVDGIPDSLPLVWYKSSDASEYHVQIATDTGFTKLFLQDSAVADTGRYVRGKSDGAYYWRVRGKNAGGWGPFSERWVFNVSSTTALWSLNAPGAFRIENSNGNLHYTLPDRSFVRIRYFDMHGRMVRTLVNAEQGPGEFSISSPLGRLEKGVYFQDFRAGRNMSREKVMTLR